MPSREFKLKLSRQLMALYASVMLVNVVILLVVSLPFWTTLLSIIIVCVYGFKIYKQHIALTSETAINCMAMTANNNWLLHTQQGLLEARLCGESTMTKFVSVLRFIIPKQQRAVSCIVFRDSLAPGLYRELIFVVKQA